MEEEKDENATSTPPGAAESEVAQESAGEEGEPKELSPEEQMALYEESLKEDDWGHQPC